MTLAKMCLSWFCLIGQKSLKSNIYSFISIYKSAFRFVKYSINSNFWFDLNSLLILRSRVHLTWVNFGMVFALTFVSKKKIRLKKIRFKKMFSYLMAVVSNSWISSLQTRGPKFSSKINPNLKLPNCFSS